VWARVSRRLLCVAPLLWPLPAGCVSSCFDRIKPVFINTRLMLEASNSLVIREISMVN
jgi:hypothetical protein